MNYKNLIYTYFALFISFAGLSAQQQIDRVAAVVGNEIILVSDIEARLKLMEEQGTSALPKKARCLIFDQLLSEALIVSEADKDSVVVSEPEVDAQLESRINQILQYMGGDPQKFLEYYGKTVQAVKDEMRDDMRRQLVMQKMKGKIMQDVTITPKEVKAFFDKIPRDSLPYFNTEVELGEIVINPKVNSVEDKKAREKAEELRLRIIEQGADFAEIAKKYSDDPGTGARGGDLGITGRGSFVTEFEAAAYQLDKMEISEVVKTEYGYHVIQLLERLGNNIHARHFLIKPEITETDHVLAKKRIDSIRTIILLDSLTFDQAAQRFSEDDFSKNRAASLLNPQTGEAYWELGDLSPEIYFAIEKLKVGEITQPIEFSSPFGETVYKIIKIRNRTAPHIANLKNDYSRIQSAATEEKRSRYIQEWVTKKIARNYVEIKFSAMGEYARYLTDQNGLPNCSSLSRWMVKP